VNQATKAFKFKLDLACWTPSAFQLRSDQLRGHYLSIKHHPALGAEEQLHFMSRPIPLSTLRPSVSTRFLTEDPSSSPQDVDQIFPNSALFDEPPDPIKSPQKRAIFDLLERPTSSSSAFLLHFASTSLIIFSAIVTILETVPSFHTTSPRVWFGLETSLVVLFTVEYSVRLFAWSSTWITLAKWVFCTFLSSAFFVSFYTRPTAFYGVIDILAILPYYIEVMLQQDTVCRRFYPFRHQTTDPSRLLCFVSPFLGCFGCCGFSGHSDIIAPYSCECISFDADKRPILLHDFLRTIEVMYLAIRRSHHALLALSFFIAMVLTVSSTLL